MYLHSSLIEARNLLFPQQKLDSSSIYRDFVFDRSLIIARSIEVQGSAKINNAKKPITYSFETQIEIHLNWYLKDIISHLLKGFFKERNTLFMLLGFCNQFFSIYQTKEFQSRSGDSIGEETEVITITTDLLL